MSNIRSASSRTSFEAPSRRTWPPSRKSFIRPGQATMQWTPCRYFESWFPFGAPPYMATERMPHIRPNLTASFSICWASSLVGDRTSRPGPSRSGLWPSSSMALKAGSRKARVLPLPVAAMPMMSLERTPNGQVYAWICEGVLKPASFNASRMSRSKALISSKVSYLSGSFTRFSSGPHTSISSSNTVLPVATPLPAASHACSMVISPPCGKLIGGYVLGGAPQSGGPGLRPLGALLLRLPRSRLQLRLSSSPL
mmetsp:Transcript_20537/g.38931  ORF Transcript_20537/g.38931 Transcript_20537/m.38931 type:complete len:254 (-) Transcript_20537:75-836(-)